MPKLDIRPPGRVPCRLHLSFRARIFATVLFGTTFWVVFTTWGSLWARNMVLVVPMLPTVLMGLLRVYLGEQWPTM